MKIYLLFVLGTMLIANVLGNCEEGDYSTCENGGDCTRMFKGDTCMECCDEVAPRQDRNALCKGRCEDDDDDDAKCSMGGNQDFLDDIVGCLENEMAAPSGLDCDECKTCCDNACADAKPGCGGASPSACKDRCKYRRCRDVCRGGDDDDDDDDDDTTETTFLSNDQTRKCSNKDSEDSCESCCENKCSNKSNSDDQLDSCKEDCIDEAACSEASGGGGGSCGDKIDECCYCMKHGCDVKSGDSPSKNKKDCIKDKCKNTCKDAGECEYDSRSKWKKVVEKKCKVDW